MAQRPIEGIFPIARVLEILAQCAEELAAHPDLSDLVTLMRRGDASREAVAWGDAAWALVSEQDRRVLFMLHAALSDGEVLEQTGSMPEDVAARVAAVASRVGPRMRTPAELRERLRHEELARLTADALGLEVAGERDATTRYLLSSIDAVTKQLESEQQRHEQALRAAKARIDQKHRPARPYGE